MSIKWKRRLVPKWRVSSDSPTVFGRDTRKSSSPQFLNDEISKKILSDSLAEFHSDPSIGLAADILRFSLTSGSKEELKPAASFLINSKKLVIPEKLKNIASEILGNVPPTQITEDILDITNCFETLHDLQKSKIQKLKRQVRAYPKNAMAWIDLARLKSSVGDNESAQKHALVALNLSPNSKFILRSTARFYVHINETERALKLIQKNPRTKIDPWLLATEISLNSIIGKPSKLINNARNLLASKNFAAADTAELAGALAVEDWSRGASKKNVKRLYIASLEAPNDNTLAQALWASNSIQLEDHIPPAWLDDPASAEAAYYRAVDSGNVDIAIKKALAWHIDEPFASRPMTAASFLATVKGEFSTASKFAELGLLSEPDNDSLLNNLTFSLLCEGKVNQALEAIAKIQRSSDSTPNPYTLANLGFLAYICDETQIADNAYLKAIKIFDKNSQPEEMTMAKICRAFAARNLPDEVKQSLVNDAIESVKKTRSNIVKRAAVSLLGIDLIKHGIALPLAEKMRVRKWIHDRDSNILLLK